MQLISRKWCINKTSLRNQRKKAEEEMETKTSLYPLQHCFPNRTHSFWIWYTWQANTLHGFGSHCKICTPFRWHIDMSVPSAKVGCMVLNLPKNNLHLNRAWAWKHAVFFKKKQRSHHLVISPGTKEMNPWRSGVRVQWG